MSKIKFNFLFGMALMLILGLNAAFANAADNKNKAPKNMGVLSVKTSPEAYPVKVDGQIVGMSGTGAAAEFYLTPGIHTVEIGGPAGTAPFTKEIQVVKGQRNCICLKTITSTDKRPCPYDISVDGPESVIDGDLITFAARNNGDRVSPANYLWAVSPAAAVITSGLGTSAITVDTRGLSGQLVTADLDVSDGAPYDATCRQRASVSSNVGVTPPKPQAFTCDIFESKAFDDDKARFDNCSIQLQNIPDSQIYMIVYQGTDKSSQRMTVDRLGKRTLNYLVQTRGIDPRRIILTNWGTKPHNTFEIWIVPPGAEPPAPK